MKTYLEVKNIIIAVLVITLSLVSFDPLGIMPNRTITIRDTIGYEVPVHDTIPQEVEVEVEVPVMVEKPVPYAVHDTIQTKVDTNFIVNQYLDSKNIFTNTYKFDK